MSLYRYLNNNLFSPPYRGLPLAVFAYVALSFLYHPHSPLHNFILGDPDDYMRLNEVINWLKGQGWYDLSHPRLAPGAHTVLHWSRLVDLPLALFMLPFIKYWGFQNAAMLASFIEPLLLFGCLLTLVPMLAEPLLGRSHARLAVLFILFVPSLLFNFSPGRVDHHNWEILIAGTGFIGLVHLLSRKDGWRMGIFAAIAFAAGCWISPEILPALLLVIGCLALFMSLRGGFALRNAAIFGLTLSASMAAILPAALPVSEWKNLNISWFSAAYVIFGALVAAMFAAAWLIERRVKNITSRMAITAVLGLLAAAVFLWLVPEALGGPFADFDNFNSSTTLENIDEAVPLVKAFHIDLYNHLTYWRAANCFMQFLLLPFLALAGLFLCARAGTPDARLAAFVYGICLSGLLLLAIFFQQRIMWFVQILELGPLAYFAQHIFRQWKKMIPRLTPARHLTAEGLGFFVLLPAFLVATIPAISKGGSLYPDLLFFPVVHPASDDSPCTLKPVAEFIASPFGRYNWRPVMILTGANEGPELLFRTPNRVIAGNFNVPSNQDVFTFFNSRDDKTATAILRKWHVDLVLTCRFYPAFYTGLNHPRFGQNAFLRPGPDGKLHLISDPEHPALIEKMVNGHPPKWLKPVEIPNATDYLLFEVDLPQAGTKPQ